MVDDPPVDFFWDPIVITSVTCLHVIDGNTEPPRNNGRNSRVRIPQDEKAVRAVFQEDGFTLFKDLCDLATEGGGAYPQKNIGRPDSELVEEDLAEPVIVVLASMNQDMRRMLIKKSDD